jgi:polysaccharide export outer membrane protein
MSALQYKLLQRGMAVMVTPYWGFCIVVSHSKIAIMWMLALLLAVSGVAVPGASAEQAPVSAASPPTALEDYRLGVADKVRVIVFNEDSLSGEFIVSDNGSLSLPLIGDVKASGRTPREVIQDIQNRLADGYLREPRVSMDVLTYRPFYILGEVGKPGEYPYSSGLTVMNAVATASGFTYRANKRKIFIKRAGETGEQVLPLTPDLRVGPGDTIRIGERYF